MNKKRKNRSVLFVICILMLATAVMCVSVISAVAQPRETELQPVAVYVGEADEVVSAAAAEHFVLPDENTPDYIVLNEKTQMRAVWVAYMSLARLNPQKIETIIANCKAIGANTVIFHVRPFGDSLYPSNYFPWSHVLTDYQGEAPSDGFDPLQYAIDCAHANGMQLHAWVNPFRIQAVGGRLPSKLSEDNPYNIFRNDLDPSNDCWVIDYKDGKFFNPGEEGARRYIINGVAEIASNYNVDGIHWDDYFYPADDSSFDDSASYQRYLSEGGTLDLTGWRTQNVNTLVRDTYNRIKAVNSNCVFGISPAGNINNCLAMGADVYEWGSVSGYVDYLCPQIYWTFESSVAPFIRRCEAWREIVRDNSVKLYIGLALYKEGTDVDNGQWIDDSSVIARQIEYLGEDELKNDGYMIFSYEDFSRPEAIEAVNMIKDEVFG